MYHISKCIKKYKNVNVKEFSVIEEFSAFLDNNLLLFFGLYYKKKRFVLFSLI